MRSNNGFVDYKQLKACVSIIMVLDHYGWLRELKGTGNTVRSRCPIHNGTNDKQFVVNIRKNEWCCFGDCRKGGSILELVAEIEKIEIREAAVRIASWFPLSLPHATTQRSMSSMSESKRPAYRIFIGQDREPGEEGDTYLLEVGAAWWQKGKKGLTPRVKAYPAPGYHYVCREYVEGKDEERQYKEEKLEQSDKPIFLLFIAQDRKEGEASEDDRGSFFISAGAAWVHGDGRGFNIEHKAMPSAGYHFVLRRNEERKDKAGEDEAKRGNVSRVNFKKRDSR